MKVEVRKRMHDDHVTYHHDLLLIAETEDERDKLDLLADPTGVGPSVVDAPVEVKAEIRLSDGHGVYYVALYPAT